MCTLALYFQTAERYPLIIAANRDEHYDRRAAAPACSWDSPRVLAGRDLRAGGTWLGVNEHGLAAAVLNRKSDEVLATKKEPRSRGLLCRDVLRCRNASEARLFIEQHDESYQPFTLVFADPGQAWSAANAGDAIGCKRLAPGLHVFGNSGMDEQRCEKIARAHELFQQLGARLNFRSNPGYWIDDFRSVLADHVPADGLTDSREAICVHGEFSGTVSSTIAVYSQESRLFTTFHCPGPPCRTSFEAALSLVCR